MTQFRSESTFGQETAADAKAKADEKKAAKKDEGAHTHDDDPKDAKANVKVAAKAKRAKKAKDDAKEEKGHPRLAKQLLDLIERIEERETPFTDDEQQIMQTAVKRLSRTMGDYRAPE